MALSFSQTVILTDILQSGMRVAAIGYPDIIAPPLMVEVLLDDLIGELEYREDSEAICKRHGMASRKIPDAQSLFKLRGCTLDVYDIVQERGCEILCDLNEPMAHVVPYDIVLDVGTAEHCFNIAQAMINMAALVKVGGVIIHENPFNCGNHGFYNLNPTFFVDFYEANGFEVLNCRLVDREGRSMGVPYTKRFKFSDGEANVFAMARRKSLVPMRYPVQSKYAGLIPVAGDRAEIKEVANV